MISQACLCITYSEIHNVDYYVRLADELIEMVRQEIGVQRDSVIAAERLEPFNIPSVADAAQ